MIKNLTIKNYAIIENLSLDFNDRFEVFTGETGAGKSIIIGALSYLCGGRADSSIVARGKDKCIIEGVFSVSEHMRSCLEEADIDFEDELIVRRVISAENRSSIRVNERNVTLGFLQELFSGEIDIHSQHDNQYLLKKQHHLELLDNYAGLSEEKGKYREIYRDLRKTEEEYHQLLNSQYDERELDFLKFSLDELTKANLQPGEEEELKKQEKRYKDFEKISANLTKAIDLYDQSEGIDEKFYELAHLLGNEDDELREIGQNLNDLYYSLQDQIEHLKQIYSHMDRDEIDIDAIQERIYHLQRLKRKYSLDEEGLIAHISELEEKIRAYENKEEFVAQFEKKLFEKRKKALDMAESISSQRKISALALERTIEKEVGDLMLPNVSFKVDFQDKADLDANGKDEVEFLISLNKGEQLKPLVKVASGGELSRLMIGLKKIFIRLSPVNLLVLDEIDTGISGITADAVGYKIAQIADQLQVIAITHLAQVAAYGDDHFYIYKEDDSVSTHTHVDELDRTQRIRELARITSSSVSEASLKAAEELLDTAQKKKTA